MEKRKEYRSAVRSKQMIRNAFLQLLREKPYEKITVTDIVTRAQINRSTFYAHYPDVNGLIEQILSEVIEESIAIFTEVDYQTLYQDPRKFLRKLLGIGMENRELYRLIGKSSQALIQLEHIKAVLLEKFVHTPVIPEEIRSQKSFDILTNYIIGGIINTYQQWNQGTLDYSEDEIIEALSNLIIASSHADVL